MRMRRGYYSGVAWARPAPFRSGASLGSTAAGREAPGAGVSQRQWARWDDDGLPTGLPGHAKEARAIQCKLIYAQHPWLAVPLKGPARDRRFEPQFDEKAKIWFVDLAPRASRKKGAG
jgi:hypothetical protein